MTSSELLNLFLLLLLVWYFCFYYNYDLYFLTWVSYEISEMFILIVTFPNGPLNGRQGCFKEINKTC